MGTKMDTAYDRRDREAIVGDVRAFDPKVRIGDAALTVFNGRKLHDDRWMEWQFENVRVEGYYSSSHAAHADGWKEWLAQNMTPEQDAAYQDGFDRGWMHPHQLRKRLGAKYAAQTRGADQASAGKQCAFRRRTTVLEMSRCQREAVMGGYCVRHHPDYWPPKMWAALSEEERSELAAEGRGPEHFSAAIAKARGK